MLAKKSMSGSEIVEVIEKETGGRWKPSSGSVYPLLARLHDTGFTTESPSEETGIKRYTLTPKGKTLFEKQINFGQKMLIKLESADKKRYKKFQFDPNDEKLLSGTREPAKRVVMTLLDLRAEKSYQLTVQDSKEIEKILNTCADDLEKILQKIREKTQHIKTNQSSSGSADM
jgi:DNA-binding PadR family transcriptional regulator